MRQRRGRSTCCEAELAGWLAKLSFAGLKCPDGTACVDDPTDGCDPRAGDRDCGGTCVPCAETGRVYFGTPEHCAVMKYGCPEGEQPFIDGCGCGPDTGA